MSSARATLVVAAMIALPTFSGCGLLGDTSRLEKALEYVPGDATWVGFTDRVALAERLGVDDVDPTDEDEVEAYLDALVDAAAGTELSALLPAMLDGDATFTDLDVEWEVRVISEDTSGLIWRLDDDLDLDEVADDLADAGYQESGDDVRRFSADLEDVDDTGLIGGRYPNSLLRVAVVPDEHLIVSGADVDRLLEAIGDDEDSLSDSGRYDDAVEDAPDDIERAQLNAGDECAWDSAGTYVSAGEDTDVETRTVLAYDDSDAAESALDDVEEQATDGTDPTTGQRLADLAETDVEREGSRLVITTDYDGESTAWRVLMTGVDPFATCPDQNADATPGAS